MATDLERLTVSLEANVKKFERELARARGVASKALGEIEREASSRESAIVSAFSSIAKRAVTALAAGFSLNEIRKAADQYIGIMNTLKTAGLNGTGVTDAFDKLFSIAQRNAVPLEALAQLYGRVSQAQTTLKATSQELVGLTEIVAQSLRVSGTSASQASGSLLQLGQALSGGKIQAEEYNSLLDGMYPLLQAAAAGLQEAGGDVSKLTALVKDGQVSSEAFFRAIQAGAPILEDKLAGATLTTAQAFERLQNEFTKAVGDFDKATGMSQTLATAIDGLAGSIGGIGRAAAGAVNGVQALLAKVNELAAANGAVQRQQALTYQQELAQRKDQAREMGLANSGGREALAQERAAANEAAATANRKALADFRSSEIEFSNALRDAPKPPTRPKDLDGRIKPVSLKDFPVPGDSKGGGGGGGSEKDKATSLDRYIINLQKAGELAKADLATAGLSNIEREKARALVEATAAAQKDHAAGLRETATLTDAEREKILGLAEATAQWKEQAKQAREAMEFTTGLAKDAFKGLVSDLMQGKSAAEALADALQKVASKLADKAIDNFIDGIFKGGGGGGGILGGFGKLLGFAGGGEVSGPGTGRSDSILARLSDGEFVVNAKAAREFAPLLAAINRGRLPRFANGGMVGGGSLLGAMPPPIRTRAAATSQSVSLAPTYHITPAEGVTPAQLAVVLERNNRQMARNLPAMLRESTMRYA